MARQSNRKMQATGVLLIGLLLSIGFGWKIWMSNQSRNWPSVGAEVVGVKTKMGHSRRGGMRRSHPVPVLEYQYTVAGARHISTRYGWETRHVRGLSVKDAQRRFPDGTIISVYVDPVNPTEAVVDRSLRVSTYVAFGVGLIFLPIALFLFRSGRTQDDPQDGTSSRTSPERSRVVDPRHRDARTSRSTATNQPRGRG
jgi:hypothetical protein